MSDMNTIEAQPSPDGGQPGFMGRNLRGLAAAVALVVAGGVVGAGSLALLPHRTEVTLLTPGPVSALTDWSTAAVKGQVAEIFGNKFVIQDDSGRALVETGPAGEGGKLVTANEPVTVQGRFEHGFLHAALIVHADGRADALGPPDRHGPHGPRMADLVHRFAGR